MCCVCYCIGYYCRPGSKPSKYDNVSKYDDDNDFSSDGHNDNISNSDMDQPGSEPGKYDNVGEEGQEN